VYGCTGEYAEKEARDERAVLKMKKKRTYVFVCVLDKRVTTGLSFQRAGFVE